MVMAHIQDILTFYLFGPCLCKLKWKVFPFINPNLHKVYSKVETNSFSFQQRYYLLWNCYSEQHQWVARIIIIYDSSPVHKRA